MATDPQQNSSEKGNDQVSFSDTIKISKWILGLVYKMSPLNTSIYILALAVNKLNPFVYAFIFTKALDELIRVLQTPNANIQMLYPYLGVMFGYSIFTTILSFVRSYSISTLRAISNTYIKRIFYNRLTELGIQTLENPEINNKVNRAEEYLTNLIFYMEDSVNVVADIFKTIAALIIVSGFFPLFIPIVVVVTIPYILVDKDMRTKLYKFSYENTEGYRKAWWTVGYLMDSKMLQEILITKAFGFLDEAFYKYNSWYNQTRIDIKRKMSIESHLFVQLRDVILFIGYIKIFTDFIVQKITIGGVAFWMRSLETLQSSITDVVEDFNNISQFVIQFKDTYALFHMEIPVKDGTIEMQKLTSGPEIIIRDMSFKYPNTNKYVLKNVNLEIKAGEKIAIVGHNGAGKTTLIKLLCRFYKVSKGDVFINGVNLNDIKIETLYQSMGVLFQDYNTYSNLTAKENIYIGDTSKPINEAEIKSAAKTADALKFINEFPKKWDQVLSERFKDGVRPSTGQWQKLAIARFFYRNAPLVFFDEPTAAIDAVSEYNIFNNIYKFFKDKTVIIISHRFSTVRNADRIIVIDNGEIVEEGTHAQLLKLNGKYAEGFKLQAEGYTK